MGLISRLRSQSSMRKSSKNTRTPENVIFGCDAEYRANKSKDGKSPASLMSQPHFRAKCENATHTPKSGKMESSGTPENSKDDLRGQISSPWCVLYINGKFLKRRCPKWPCIAHLDICSPSYGQKKGWESNCQFDSRPLKVRNRPLPNVASRSAT